MSSDPLLQPFEFCGLTLRNRIVSTSHEPAYTEGGMPTDRYRLYHREKARGGVGMTMIGGSSLVSRDSPSAFGNIDMTTDAVVPWLRAIADDCHAEGAAVTVQLTHLGPRASSYAGDWLPVLGPSRTREPQHRSFTKAMDEHDFRRVVDDFAAAARRAAEAGLDGVELELYGHLLDSFLLTWTNVRDDEYNGDLVDRLRFPLRVIRAVREAVPEGFLVGARLSVDSHREDGIVEAEAIQILSVFASAGIDFFSLVAGLPFDDPHLARSIPGMGTPSAPFLELCRRVRSALDVPIIHATRIADVPTARYAVEGGCLDLVGMTRAQLADPHLVTKLAEGREDDIRPCVGANQCLDGIYSSGSSTCIHNPATGREQILPHTEPAITGPPRTIVVVGAGPAGLEAARVSGVRGHRVVVLEADATYGGQVRLAGRSARRRDLVGIVDWRYQQAVKHGVDLRFDTYADADTVMELRPDVVIVATGGLPDAEYGLGEPPVHDTWDVMNGALRHHESVIVFDDHGGHPALDAVEMLARNRQAVTYISPERTIGVDVGSLNSPAYLEVFSECGVRTVLTEMLVGVREEDGIVIATTRNVYSGRESEYAAAAVVVEHGTLPMDDLYVDLAPQARNRGAMDIDALVEARPQPAAPGDGFDLFRIGDAVSSRSIHAAILDALRLTLGL